MDNLTLPLEQVLTALEPICSRFNLPVARVPQVELDPALPAEGKFYYQREPFFYGYVKINPAATMTIEKGQRYILDHALIHWTECENNLNSYRGNPFHLLSILYQGQEERQRVLEIAHPHMTADIFFGRYAEPQQREEVLRFVDSHYTELRKRVVAYAGTDGSSSERNLATIGDILQKAKQFAEKHGTVNVGEEIMLSFMCQDYAELLSVYAADKLAEKPFQSIEFLRKLRQQRETALEKIGKKPLLRFFHFEKYARLLEQCSYSG